MRVLVSVLPCVRISESECVLSNVRVCARTSGCVVECVCVCVCECCVVRVVWGRVSSEPFFPWKKLKKIDGKGSPKNYVQTG